MVVKVELEFTDAQWALIEEHHPYVNDVPVTISSVKGLYEDEIKSRILSVMRDKASLALEDSFDV